MRYKRPDKKNALSILEASERDMKYTLSLGINELSGPTIVRNIHECFRMLGDALLISQGMEPEDHVTSIKELMELQVKSDRSVYLLDNLRRLRNNINYYGYTPSLEEVSEMKKIALSLYNPLAMEVRKKIT